MKKFALVAFAFLIFSTGQADAFAPLDKIECAKVVRKFFALYDKTTFSLMLLLFTDNPTLIDDFPPYHWEGGNWFHEWEGRDKTDFVNWKTTLPQDIKVSVTKDHTYSVIPITESVRTTDGKSHELTATVTFAFDHTRDGWKIAAYAWTDGTFR